MKDIPTIKELRRECQLSAPKETSVRFAPKHGINIQEWLKSIYRKVSIFVTKIFLYSSITANQVTIISILVGTAGGFLLVLGKFWSFITGALLIVLFDILDHVDGEIARYRKTVSLKGQYLDVLAHFIVGLSVSVGLAVGVYGVSRSNVILVFGLILVVFRILTKFVTSAYYKTLIIHLKVTLGNELSMGNFKTRKYESGIKTKKKSSLKTLKNKILSLSSKPFVQNADFLIASDSCIPYWILIAALLNRLTGGIPFHSLKPNYLSFLLIIYSIAHLLRFMEAIFVFLFSEKIKEDFQMLFKSILT